MHARRKFFGFLQIITILSVAQIGYVFSQDSQPFFFGQTGQGRFVPSFQSNRNGFFSPSSFNTLKNTHSQSSSPPGSFPEQTLFLGNEASTQRDSASSFGHFSPFQSTRSPDYFDLSPRPFGVVAPSSSFVRPNSIRPSGSGGFVPSKTGRPNVPHQQSQFLAHFNEQSHPSGIQQTEKATTQSSRVTRPLGTGFSRNRPASGFNKQNTEDLLPSQQQLPFRNSRNRFQPSAERTTTTTTTTTTEKSSRFNRFGSGRSVQTPKVPTSSSPPRPKPNKTLFQPRRPVFISREVNEPVHLKNKDFPNKITINHNGSNNNHDEEEEDILEEEINEANHVQDKPGNDDGKEIPPESYEKLGLHEPIKSSTTQDPGPTAPESPDAHTVILTSNFFLPQERPHLHEEDSESRQTSIEEQVHQVPVTTHNPADYEYEYEDYDDNSTTISTLTKPANVEENAEKSNNAAKTESETIETEEAGVTKEIRDISTDSSESPPPPETTINQEQSGESSSEYDDEEFEDEEEGEEEEEEERDGEISEEPEKQESVKKDPSDIVGQAVVQVITTKSVINGSTAYPQQVTPSATVVEMASESEFRTPEKVTETIKEVPVSEEPKETAPAPEDETVNNATESYVVVASIQTSRSISGARFLPFPVVEQEEKKQTLSELERKIHEQKKKKSQQTEQESEVNQDIAPKEQETTIEPAGIATDAAIPETTTEKSTTNQSISTESIIDKLDRVQSELSSGLLTGKFPILNEMPELDLSSSTTTAAPRFVPNIRKFVPKTTTVRPEKKVDIDSIPMDDLTGLLPPGFKPRISSFRNRKITTTTTTTEAPKLRLDALAHKPSRNATIGRSFKNSAVVVQDIALAGLLPKGYKLNTTITTESPVTQKSIKDLLSQIKFEDNLDKLLPKDYKEKASKTTSTTTSKPSVTVVDDLSKFLPPGYKHPASTTTRKPLPVIPIKVDITKLLPPGYKASNATTTEKPSIGVVPLQDDISKFLPPGFKPDSNKKGDDSGSIDISKLLPIDYKPKVEVKEADSILKKIEFKDVSSLLPFDYKESSAKEESSPVSTDKPDASPKVIFPKGLNKRPGARLTTPKTPAADGPSPPQILIKKGPPTRVTTEFTGWPTPSTTPFSIEKLLEQQRTASIDLSDLLPSSTTTSTTSTTTTTPEPPKPTEPGLCHFECDLAGTIKIIDGVKWKPELLDHNTDEWKTLAREVEAQLNEVYSSAPRLSKWYKKVRIDSFNKGSVLVDYFVELSNISRDVDTLEIKQLFHEALTAAPLAVVPLPESNETTTSDDNVDGRGEKLVKETYLLGRFVVDPVSTDFIVIPKPVSPIVEFAEEELLIPQWAIVVIVIGVGSLCFIVIFGVTVLVNRQKRAKKTPTPLTNDMLHELNKNHMGGVDNYGADEFYNVEDTWNDTKQPIKPKRFTNSMHGSSASNIYDSWRSQRGGDYYYDNHNYTPHKIDPYPPDAFSDAHQMYTYNPRSRYYKDYDPEF